MIVVGIKEFDSQVRVTVGWILARAPMHAASKVRV
jgi:hypothetical protein